MEPRLRAAPVPGQRGIEHGAGNSSGGGHKPSLGNGAHETSSLTDCVDDFGTLGIHNDNFRSPGQRSCVWIDRVGKLLRSELIEVSRFLLRTFLLAREVELHIGGQHG